jgi:thioredoxin 2
MTTIRCPFCLTLNRVDLARAADRPRCGECERPLLLDRPVKVTEEDFQRTVLDTDGPVLVDFYADWCAPCKVVAPVLDELARAHTGRLLVAKVDADHAQRVSVQHGVRGLPTIVLFQSGAEAGRVVGADPAGVRELVKGALEAAGD